MCGFWVRIRVLYVHLWASLGHGVCLWAVNIQRRGYLCLGSSRTFLFWRGNELFTWWAWKGGCISSNTWLTPFSSPLGSTAHSLAEGLARDYLGLPAKDRGGSDVKSEPTHLTAASWLWPVHIQAHTPYRVEGDTSNLWMCVLSTLPGISQALRKAQGTLHKS